MTTEVHVPLSPNIRKKFSDYLLDDIDRFVLGNDGCESDTVKAIEVNQDDLNNRVFTKSISVKYKNGDRESVYVYTLSDSDIADLADILISEVGLLDKAGSLVYARNFNSTALEIGQTYTFTMRIPV